MSVRNTVEVRKYGNRKLYDEEHATYVSMLGLSSLVAEGSKVHVTCDLTGNDLTLETLARALYERSKVASSDTDRESIAQSLTKIITQITVDGETKE